MPLCEKFNWQYADRIDTADVMLAAFVESVNEDTASVQLALLTAIVKLFIRRPTAGELLLPKILEWATETCGDPDIRDRIRASLLMLYIGGFIYWRLLSTDPVVAKQIVFGDRPNLSSDIEVVDDALVDQLCLYIASIASIYHKPASSFIGRFNTRTLKQTPVLVVERKFYADRSYL